MSAIGDGFKNYGVDHLSASSLNSAAMQISAWLLERVLDRRVPVGCAAHRGTSVEAGVTVGLLYPDKPVAECQEIAMQSYNGLTALSTDHRREQEREAVKPTVATALAELRQYGIPSDVQTRIEKELVEGLPPLIGFIDYGWSEFQIILDLKTSLRLASDISPAHGRQVAGYVHGTNSSGRLCYCTPRKSAVYELDRVDERFAELANIAVRLDRFLALSKDPMELAGLVICDVSHFLWANPQAEAARREIYGM